MQNKFVLESTITCPHCGFQKEEPMPVDACQYFYTCTNCQTILKPKQWDCCVFCSYGTMKCPPIQQSGKKMIVEKVNGQLIETKEYHA